MTNSSATTTGSTLPGDPAGSASGLPLPASLLNKNSREDLAKKWWGKKIADEALQVEKDRRRQLVVERLIKKTQDGTLEQATEDPWPDDASDEMGVRVGDDTTVHYHLPPVREEQQRRSGLGPLGKVLLGGALLAGGVGLGAGIPLILAALDRPAGDTDSDTAYIVDIGKEPVP